MVVPVLVILGLVLFSPKIISDPTRRIIQFNHDFKKPLPYKIELMNTDLTALEQEDFEVKVRVTGEEIPAELFLKVNEFSYKMNKGHGFDYVHLFKALSANTSFRILAGDFQSEEYIVHVFPKALILNFDILINYPAYINKSDEKLENLGDLTVPEGSKVTWKFHAKDVRNINFRLNKDKLLLVEEGRQTFVGSSRITGSCTYCVAPVNANTLIPDSIVYKINVVNDGYPSIFVNEAVDSLLATNLFCKGTIKDDYGFSKLTFNYRIFLGSDSANLIYKSEPVSIDKSVNNQVFYYSVDLLKLLPEPGQQISYYFEIWDNDGVNGPKSSKSEVKSIKTPSTEEIVAHIGDNEQSINQDFEKSIADSKAMKKNMDELNKKLIDQKDLSWQEKRKVEDVIKANAAINEKIEKIKRNNQENINNEEKSLQVSQRIIDKQKQLNELMDQLLSEEMKKMMEELKELMKQVDKAKLASLLEKMKMSNKELETQLDRNLALMKQIEFDRKVEAMVNDIRKTAESQEKLAKETEGKDKNSADLMKEQEKIGDKTDSLFKQMSALEKLGKELESPADLGNSKPKQESIKKSQEESKNKLLEKKNSEAAGAQKKVAKEMKELADQMEESQEENEDNQLEEDAANIRMILENLVRLSFEQEEMIVKTRVVLRNDPKFTEIVFRQKEFGEKIKVVEDSMNAIAKRQIMIKPVVSKEILSINQNISLALDAMDTRNINQAVAKQQYVMTSINNLALLLNEALEKMNEKLSMKMKSKSGNKSCSKPSSKGGKMSAKSMKEMQEKLGGQLGKLKEALEGAKKQGNGSKTGQQGMNREVARLAAQQEALRNEMQKYQDEMGAKGLKEQSNLNEAGRDMEQIEKNVLNKNISQETFLRQQKIISRLLESEIAEQTRDQEEKRESTEAKNPKTGNPGSIFQYNSKVKASQDNLNLMLPSLNMFYKNKVNSYTVKIER